MMNVDNNMSKDKKKVFGRFVRSHADSHFNCFITNLMTIPRLGECLNECLQGAWKYISTPKNRLILQPYLGLCAIYQIALRKINSFAAPPSTTYEKVLFKHICRTLCAFIPYDNGDIRERILNIGFIRYYIASGNLDQLNDDFFLYPLPEEYSFKNFMQLIVDTAEKQEAEKQEAEKKSPQMHDDGVDNNVGGGKLRRRRQYRRRRSIKKSKSRSRSRSKSRSRFRKVRKTRRYRK